MPIDQGLATKLDRLSTRMRWLVVVYGVSWVLACFLIGALLICTADFWLRGLQWSMRLVILLVLIGSTGWVMLRRLVSPLGVPMGRSQMANLIERKYPQLSSSLISAVRFAQGEMGAEASNSRELVKLVIDDAAARAGKLDFNQVLDSLAARRAAAGAFGIGILVAATAFVMPESFRIGVARNLLLQDVEWPRRTTLILEVDGNEMRAARGDDVVIEALAEGVQPRSVDIYYQTESGDSARESMVTVGSAGAYRYRFTIKAVEEEFTFYLRGGDHRTERVQVRLVDRPHLASSTIQVTPPAYAGLPSMTLGDGERATRTLKGSTVRIDATFNKPLATATLRSGNQEIAEAVVTEDRATVEFTIGKTRTYHFSLVDNDALENRQPERFSIRAMKDDPPRVKLLLPGVGDMITTDAVLPLELSLDDQYGLARAELTYQLLREDAEAKAIDLVGFEIGSKSYLSTIPWPVSQALVEAGDRITMTANAADADDVSGPNEAQSVEHILRVVTRDEFLADIARREQEYRQAFERLLESQEQLRGELLSVRSELEASADSPETQSMRDVWASRLSSLERRQRNLTASVTIVRQQFEQIMKELEINGLDTRDERERLETNIIDILAELTRRDMVVAADALRTWSRQTDADSGRQTDELQETIIKKMRSVLANMIQWEGYYEVVTMLRDIIRLQKELGDEAGESLLEEAEGVFEE
ncbi:MAG: hypothetical protein ACPGXK_11210 [Phycisphaerae bacterium]